MPSILNLKFKGNKSFVAFSNLNDAESLTQTWKVCTKVASFLEQGQRLENLSWRLWHLQNLIVDTDNAKSRREFRKLSKCMGDKLDKEKGRSIEELSAPDFKRNHSTDMIKQRAAEKERNREVNQYVGGTIKRMQFTFSVDQLPQLLTTTPVNKPDTKPSAELSKRSRAFPQRVYHHHEDTHMTDPDISSVKSTTSDPVSVISAPIPQAPSQALHFPTLFNDSFGPSALLYAAPTLTTTMTYGEGYMPSSSSDDQFRISRPTIEVPLDEILFNDDCSSDSSWTSAINLLCGAATAIDITPPPPANEPLPDPVEEAPEFVPSASPDIVSAAGQQHHEDIIMLPADLSDHSFIHPPVSLTPPPLPIDTQFSSFQTDISSSSDTQRSSSVSGSSSAGADDESVLNEDFSEDEGDIDERSPAPSTARRTSIFKNLAPISNTLSNPETVAPSRLHSIYGTRSSTPNTSRPTLTLKTQGAMTTRSSGPGATLTSLNPAILRGNSNNNGPGGVKAECSNCGATHTPLWRRGLNDELNCNACGLYCKLHKRPRPKSMRSSTQGETRAPSIPRPEPVEPVGNTTTTRPRSLSNKAPPFPENPPARQSVIAQCYNCHTTATPLWRKDDEGKTVCNACGLYYKLHGSARPISMKSDIIRKRSRHDARRSSQSGLDDLLPPSPGFSHRASPPIRDSSPTLAPDSTTQMSYDFGDDATEFRSSSSELVGALGNPSSSTNGSPNNNNNGGSSGGSDSNGLYNTFPVTYSGPQCNPDYLIQLYGLQSDPLPFSGGGGGAESNSDSDPSMSPRSNKRRRMSTDSASEPPSSASSFSSFGGGAGSNGGDGYTSAASSVSSSSQHHSRKCSMDFPFPTYTNGTMMINNNHHHQGPALRGPGNTFWHPPMMPQPSQSDQESSSFWHPPLVVPQSNKMDSNEIGGGGVVGSSSSSSSLSKGLMMRRDYSSSAGSGSGSDDSGESCVSSSVRSCGGNSGSGNGKQQQQQQQQQQALGGKTEDTTMDFLHALQDDELFSAYLHPHDEKTMTNTTGTTTMTTGGGGGHAMYVDSFFQ